jgi:hypothetical protein
MSRSELQELRRRLERDPEDEHGWYALFRALERVDLVPDWVRCDLRVGVLFRLREKLRFDLGSQKALGRLLGLRPAGCHRDPPGEFWRDHGRLERARLEFWEDAEERLPVEFLRSRDEARMVLVPSDGVGETFLLDRRPVTVGQFGRFLAGTGEAWEPSGRPRDWPVVGVDRARAEAYCRWAGGRLPTENEWERAGRGLDGRKLPWGERRSRLPFAPWTSEAQVGQHRAGRSPYGVEDLLGLVHEWCAGPGGVIKGGTPDGDQALAHLGWREVVRPDLRREDVGFRVAKSI